MVLEFKLRTILTIFYLNLRLFRYLCFKLGPEFCKKAIGSKAVKLLTADDIKEVKTLIQPNQKPMQASMQGRSKTLILKLESTMSCKLLSLLCRGFARGSIIASKEASHVAATERNQGPHSKAAQ